jgi:3',5'-cyclic AMP phosphodiesterase CpdA
MTADVQKAGKDAPAFFFHLGDIVYEFGEDRYYYDQFYEPFRAYDRPIFAIPGNHDGVVYGQSADTPAVPTLTAYLRNFCATTPGHSADAGALVRSTMDQPGVYFTLDAPHVSIIGLYSNVLEGPGVISTQGGKYSTINDDQLDFLTSELTRLKPASEQGERAVVLAVHHPPASADATHSGSTGLASDIDACAQKAGFWPDAVLSGHAHLYQRFTRRTSDGREIPYIVAGAGGYNATKPQSEVKVGTAIGDYTLAAGPIVHFGYLTATVDVEAHTLQFTYHPTQSGVKGDKVTIDLAKHSVS